jgi:MFS family permease
MNSPSQTFETRLLPRLGAGPSLWLTGLILMSFLAASSVPSPLYALYREMWGFSPVALTIVFASYAVAMLAALLVFGALSDYRGRREVVMASIVLEIASLALFWGADSVNWLVAARVLQGVATGIASSALGAALVDQHRDRGALINSVAPMLGLGAGGLGASLLVQFAPAPTRLVFDILLLVFVLLLVAAAFLPETAARRPGAWRSLRPRVAIPQAARATLLRVLPVNTAQWALGGFYFSLGPTLARTVSGSATPLAGGLMIAALAFSSALAVALVRKTPPPAAIRNGAAALGLGVLVSLAGVHWSWPVVALLGTVIAGAGFGSSFSGALRSLVPLAPPQERAALMAGFFAASYLAFSLPAIVAGLFTSRIGLQATALGYGSAIALMSLFTLAAAVRNAKAVSR